ncbi:MAG TPA: hypothetical protein VL727_28255 [Puia sp.]|jgi:hypothetical protein|nr:hypothetical protein [Puia sp.]
MKKRIHKILFYTLILSVYGVFFSVESFFNFEGQNNTKDLFKYSAFVHFSGYHQSVIKTTPLQSSSKHNVRLNKRYHQEDIAPCPLFSVAAPVLRVIPRVLGTCSIIPLPCVTVAHHRLRGPPFVA